MNFLNQLIRLSRIGDFVSSITLATVLGIYFAGATQNISIVIIIFANLLGASFGFMINDIEDSEADALDKIKKKRNIISAGIILKKQGYIMAFIVGLISLLFYAILNIQVLIIGIITLIVGYMYSSHLIRFKSMVIVDVLTHGLTWGGVQFVLGYLAFSNSITLLEFILPFLGLVFYSIHVDLSQEIRDYKIDIKEGLRNTTILIGIKYSKIIASILHKLSIFLIFLSVVLYTSVDKYVILTLVGIFSVTYTVLIQKYFVKNIWKEEGTKTSWKKFAVHSVSHLGIALTLLMIM